MKRPYLDPEFDLVKLVLMNEVMFHSQFEEGGENSGWDWNDGDDIPPP